MLFHHFALRTFLPEAQRTRLADAPEAGVLRIRARAAGGPTADRLEVALVERDGTAWGTVVDLTDRWRDFAIPLSELRRTRLALLPRPYPLFLPYLIEISTTRTGPRVAQLDGLQFSVSRGLLAAADVAGAHGFVIERVMLDFERP